MSEERQRATEFRFLLAVLILAGILAFFVFEPFLYYVAFGVLLVSAFWPIHRRLQRIFKNRAFAAFLSFLLVFIVLVGPIVLVGMLVFQDAVNFARTYDPARLNETLQPMLDRFGLHGEQVEEGNATFVRPGEAANWLGDTLQQLAENIGQEFVQLLPHLAIGLFVTGFVVFYGFADGERFYRQLRYVMPLPDPVEDELFRSLKGVTSAVFVGSVLIGFLSAVLGVATFMMFGVPNPVFWGFIMLILGILPIVGAPFVWVPVSLWLYLQGDVMAAATIFIINTIFGWGYIEHVLRPKLIGRLGKIHPVWVLIGVLGGIEVFGILGFVLGPLALAVFIALVRSYTEFHPRWVERSRRGDEPFHPEGVLRPQPFEKPPEGEGPPPPQA
jgi:predicted PurR-regulated permease PerM